MKHEAKTLLSAAGIAAGQSFESLNPDQKRAIRAEAEVAYMRKYGATMPAGDAWVAKRYALLQQRARS